MPLSSVRHGTQLPSLQTLEYQIRSRGVSQSLWAYDEAHLRRAHPRRAVGRRVDDSGGMQRYENRAGISLAMFNDQSGYLATKDVSSLDAMFKVARGEERRARKQTLNQSSKQRRVDCLSRQGAPSRWGATRSSHQSTSVARRRRRTRRASSSWSSRPPTPH